MNLHKLSRFSFHSYALNSALGDVYESTLSMMPGRPLSCALLDVVLFNGPSACFEVLVLTTILHIDCGSSITLPPTFMGD